jgi:hypothetical protein
MSKEIQCKKCAKNKGKCTEKCLPKDWNKKPEGVYTSESMQFELTEDQVRKFRAWQKTKPSKYLGAIGGHYSIQFMMTSIGCFASATCWDGTEIDLTDYDKL